MKSRIINKVHPTYVYITLLFFLITIYSACQKIIPDKDMYELIQSTCIRETNTINCPDSSLFHIRAKGKAFGPVGTYVVIVSDNADSTVLDCGSWTLETDGTIIGCLRNADQNKETEFTWRGYFSPCLPLNAYYEDLEFSVATNTSLLTPFYLFDNFIVSCRP